MNISITRCLLVISLLFSSHTWSSFVILADDRQTLVDIPPTCVYINGVCFLQGGGANIETPDGAVWNNGREQHSEIGSTSMSGRGEVSTSGIPVNNSGGQTILENSRFDVTFTVDQDTTFNLSGLFYDVNAQLFTPFSNASLSANLIENGSSIFSAEPSSPYSGFRPIESDFVFSGTFYQGNTYQLILDATSDRLGTHGWDFELTTVSEVPLPAGLWLMLSALGSLLIAKNRSQTKPV